MPVFVAMLGGMLLSLVSTIVGRVLIALGIGTATYTGISTLLDYLLASSINAFTSLPPEAVALLGVLKIGEFISIVSSAVAARLLLSGLQSGSFKRFVKK